jgi:hypothetical protein
VTLTVTTEATLPEQMTDDWSMQYAPVVARIASNTWKKSTIFTVDDIEQAIWEHAVNNWKYYVKADPKMVEIYMAKAARGFAHLERIDHMYFTGAFIYTPKLVAAYLETCAWKPLEEVPDVDARVDLQEAFILLSDKAPKQAEAVFKRYGLGEDDLSAAERMNVSRGVETICHRLNSGLRLQAESIDLTIAQEL